ncbi:spore germination protein [Paenibacillus sp. BR2-3]|uniref:spore germination protein n=1 Tax=Paenibacillus sp. BR2-3 TaxID=3048494 RepID=UPI0039777D28
MGPKSIRLSTLNDLEQFTEDLKRTFGSMPDLVFRSIGSSLIVYISGLVDQQRIEREIIDPLSTQQEAEGVTVKTPSVEQTTDYQKTVQAVLSGMAAVAVCGREQVILANVAAAPHRSVTKPETETVVHGPREGFVEHIDINIALIRRILKSEKLRMKKWNIGSVAQTEVRLAYLDGVAPNELVSEISNRISSVRLEGILDSNYLTENIKDRPLSIFPTLQTTERPDVVADALLKGKVAVIVNNSPFALILPFTFWNAFQSIEDYYLLYSSATFLRVIRAFFIISALFLPSLYVAITTFHVEMIPTELLLSIAVSREPSPFPALVEALIMESVFEALREAIVRLPTMLGQAVSVLGALVIGQAVVQAGIVSIPMIIVVSITGIASLMIPRYEMTFAVRILRILLLLLAGTFGLFGIALGLYFTQIYLTGISSAGMPYLSPIAPLLRSGLKDFLIRKPFGRK